MNKIYANDLIKPSTSVTFPVLAAAHNNPLPIRLSENVYICLYSFYFMSLTLRVDRGGREREAAWNKIQKDENIT